jgi:hypothetical protein
MYLVVDTPVNSIGGIDLVRIRQVLRIQLPSAASGDYNQGKFSLLSLQCAHCQWKDSP